MATYSIANIKTKLQTALRDPNDTKWSSQEKDEYLQESINDDPVLAYETTDTSLTSSTSTYAYALPTGVFGVRKIIITSGSTDYQVGKSEWVEEGGQIYFSHYPSQSGTMKLFGLKQYATTDSIPDKFLNYILASAVVKAYEGLMVKYQADIVPSDVTQAEIISALSYWRSKKEEEEKKIPNKVMYEY